MKIEKINDNKIKCILNKNDLSIRNINISDFSYGSEKTNELFREMTSKAYQQFGFQTGDSPLTIEAIPLSDESVELIISKSDDPEELDTRFSKFTPTPDDVANAVNESISSEENKFKKANEILNLLSSFRDAIAGVASTHSKPSITGSDKLPKQQKNSQTPIHTTPENISLVFSFKNIDSLIALSKALAGKYHGKSSIYQRGTMFYLLINNKEHTPEEFNRMCNIICEYGEQTKFNKLADLFLPEHYDIILDNNALEELCCIS